MPYDLPVVICCIGVMYIDCCNVYRLYRRRAVATKAAPRHSSSKGRFRSGFEPLAGHKGRERRSVSFLRQAGKA